MAGEALRKLLRRLVEGFRGFAKGFVRSIVLYVHFAAMNWRRVTASPADFFIGFAAVALQECLGLATIVFMMRGLPSVRGWTFWEIVLIYGFFTTARSLWHVFMINGMDLSSYIRLGRLDRFLVRPLDPLFQIYTDSWDEDGWGELAVGVVLLATAAPHLGVNWWADAPLLVVNLVAGALVYASIILAVSSLSFWTVENDALIALLQTLGTLGQYPLTMYSRVLQWVLSTALPFAFVGFWPAQAFLRRVASPLTYATPLVAIALFYAAVRVFKAGLRCYQGTGT